MGFNVSYQVILVTSIDYSKKKKLNTIFQHFVSFSFSKSLVFCQIFSIWKLPVSRIFLWSFSTDLTSLISPSNSCNRYGKANSSDGDGHNNDFAPDINFQIPKNTCANTKYKLHFPQYQISRWWWWWKWLARLALIYILWRPITYPFPIRSLACILTFFGGGGYSHPIFYSLFLHLIWHK